MRFFGLTNCDTCRKALRSLTEAGIELAITDVRKDGVSTTDLEAFFAEFGDQMVNKRSTTWRGLSDQERGSDPLRILAKYPTLMKRPVIETDDGRLFLGWSKSVADEILGGVS